MSIIKIKKRVFPYVQIDRTPIQSKNLSWGAKGLLTYLMSKPADWQVMVTELHNNAKNGKDGTRTLFNELLKAGYITRGEKRKRGKFDGFDYVVKDTIIPDTEKPDTEKPAAINPSLQIKSLTNKELQNSPTKKSTPLDSTFMKQYEISLHNFRNWDPRITPDLKTSILEYFDYRQQASSFFGVPATLTEQFRIIGKYLDDKFTPKEISASLKEAISRGNVQYNPEWTINRSKKAENKAKKQYKSKKQVNFSDMEQLLNDPDFLKIS